ncbi:MAG: MarR family transcriptional regulator [Corynebacterium sp.]|uniref:MarR family winged helix-turn-helix transcriptional regulator n=1 Tax=Corynebacterium sp. TaxID=1720 RepID=UPI0026DCF134|nr:MarR family transcriptional regulator [Corynebacterium sp.]MDO4761971.1 MarR family transcriptional regulator [Corynebacterium sp.]
MSAQEKLNAQMCFQLYTGARLMQRMYRPYFDEWGITYPQYLVLLCLWEKDQQSIAELGALLDLDSGTLSPLLKRMEKSELVNRKIDESDYRRVLFSLTPQAKRLQAKAEEMLSEIESGVGIAQPDVEAVRRVIDKINPAAS